MIQYISSTTYLVGVCVEDWLLANAFAVISCRTFSYIYRDSLRRFIFPLHYAEGFFFIWFILALLGEIRYSVL